jgi:hypothetical protein
LDFVRDEVHFPVLSLATVRLQSMEYPPRHLLPSTLQGLDTIFPKIQFNMMFLPHTFLFFLLFFFFLKKRSNLSFIPTAKYYGYRCGIPYIREYPSMLYDNTKKKVSPSFEIAGKNSSRSISLIAFHSTLTPVR